MLKTYASGALSGLLAVVLFKLVPRQYIPEVAGIVVGFMVSFAVSSWVELKAKLTEITALKMRLLDWEIHTAERSRFRQMTE